MKEFWYRLTQIHLEKAVRMYRDLNNIKTRPRTLVFGFADVTLAGEERLMVLRWQVHVVVRQRLFGRRFGVSLVLGSAEKVHGVAPHFALCNSAHNRYETIDVLCLSYTILPSSSSSYLCKFWVPARPGKPRSRAALFACYLYRTFMPSVFGRYCLGHRKGIQPAKTECCCHLTGALHILRAPLGYGMV